ncbi:MAG: SH3 domain-containing protein [Thermoanaerobaculia bacterium]
MSQRQPAPLFALVYLVVASGCSSAPGARTERTALPAHDTTISPAAPTTPYLATLTVDAEAVPVYAHASDAATVVATVRSGERLRLLERQPAWLFVRTPSGADGYVAPGSLVASTCNSDRPAPVVIEEPVFRFSVAPPHGAVVIEAEYTSQAELVSSRVLQNSLGDPAYERQALEDLRSLRFLPPTSACKPRAFFYTFTRRF